MRKGNVRRESLRPKSGAGPVLPAYARAVRTLSVGLHPYVALLPKVKASPAFVRIAPEGDGERLLESARVRIDEERGFAYIDTGAPCIVLAHGYYREGSDLDLYLDLLHELTHLRQLRQGLELWDESFAYPDRPTEIEGYAVAVAEGRRLGMSEAEVLVHLSNPWMSEAEVARLLRHVDEFLGG
jgi:hypothetical protein